MIETLEKKSNCCGSDVTEDSRCRECHEGCTAIYCDDCQDTGKVVLPAYNLAGQIVDEEQIDCHCQHDD